MSCHKGMKIGVNDAFYISPSLLTRDFNPLKPGKHAKTQGAEAALLEIYG
jgi:hypothetical protein